MSLLERVSTLLRANLNDLVEKAEDPERMLKQIVLDMENQLMQVKTQVAIAIADQHLLEKKRAEHEQQAGDWRRKAELAVQKNQDDLARPLWSAREPRPDSWRDLHPRPRIRSMKQTVCDRRFKAGTEAERDAGTQRNADSRASQSEGCGTSNASPATGRHRPGTRDGAHEKQGPCEGGRECSSQRDSFS